VSLEDENSLRSSRKDEGVSFCDLHKDLGTAEARRNRTTSEKGYPGAKGWLGLLQPGLQSQQSFHELLDLSAV
jgi:hypothetical protein